MASKIGIKIANGEFYPIMEENSMTRKRLILTTVHDNQPSMQIDLYRSASGVMSDAQYIGSLVVENIKPKLKGDPSIEMVISSKSSGEIIADAIDLDTGANGEHYVLTVSLKSLDESSRDISIPDFELEASEPPPSGLYQHANRIRQEEKRSSNLWVFILIGIILILGLAALWFFLFGGKDKLFPKDTSAVTQILQPEPVRQPEPVTVIKAEPEPVKPEPEPVKQPEPAPVIKAPVEPPAPKPQTQTVRKRPPAPVKSYKVPATIPRNGAPYTIRWGDTLWDIADAFYRNPWLYPRIARYNNIKNPDLIISGRTIRIPPKN